MVEHTEAIAQEDKRVAILDPVIHARLGGTYRRAFTKDVAVWPTPFPSPILIPVAVTAWPHS
jgi:hypothetical protein